MSYYRTLIQNTIVPDLIAAYQLSDGTDSYAGLNGTAINVVFNSVNAVNGNAGQFDSLVSPGIIIPDNNIFSFTNGTTDIPYSIKCNIFLRTINTLSAIFWKGDGTVSPTREYYFYIDNTNRVRIIHCSKSGTGVKIDAFTTTTLARNTPYNIVLTYNGNGSSSGFEIYVNGVSQPMGSANVGTYTTMNNTGVPPSIGSNNNRVLNFRGTIDELYIFKKELSQAEVTTLQTNFYPNI